MSELIPGEGGELLPGVTPAPKPHPFQPKPEPPVVIPGPAPEPTPEPGPAPPPEPVPPHEGGGDSLPGLGDIASLLVLLGLILLGAALADALNKIARTLLGPLWPRTGGKSLTPEQLTQTISSSLGNAFEGIDAELGLAFQQMATTTSRIGAAIVNAEAAIYRVATTVAGHSATLSRVQTAGAAATAKATSAAAVAAEALTAAHSGSEAAKARESALELELGRISTHITHVIEPELERMRHAIPELEKGATTAWDTLKQHSEQLGIAGVTAMVAAGLSRLGGSWIRCETNQLVGEALCGSDSNLIRKLLSGLLDALAIADLCELAVLLMDAAEGMVPLLEGFVDVEMALVGCHGFDRPPAIPLPALSMTPVLEPIAL